MTRIAAWAVGAALLAGFAPVAQAQNRAEVMVEGRTDTGGANPACMLVVSVRNVGDAPLRVFVADVTASDAGSGQPLRMPMVSIPLRSIEPGQTKEWSNTTVSDARCEQVRLQVMSVTCMRRCESVTWRQQGLAALAAPQ
ncbi:hypothetical protein KPL78_19730 [Roseomonas sp. HJA6]|uniref:DUF11 domain-containing protein n=1 Tax=Roseomonas alba TaxID=2846776 RepID=A0ABS7AFY4_9PROT|nr:hypothetical protein [Neoroseomonas alba]MBW6400099.1 hypothetical protein [Neoroseomonas alba]